MSCLRALLVGPPVEDEAKLAPLFEIQECNRVLRRDLSFQAQTPQPVICFYDGSKVLWHAAARSRKMQYLLSLIFWWKQTGGSDVQLRKRATLSAQLPRLAGGTRRLYAYRWLRVDEDGPAGAVITSDIAGSCTPGLLLYQRPTCKITATSSGKRGIFCECSWKKPLEGIIKINTDGSVMETVAGAGMIPRDHEAAVIFSACRHIYQCTDVLEAGLLALREGISLAPQWSNFPIDVETDCLEAVISIKGGRRNKSKYAFIIREIIDLLEERSSCITHSCRNCNNISHALAKFGRLQDRTMVWLGSSPDEVLELVRRDCST